MIHIQQINALDKTVGDEEDHWENLFTVDTYKEATEKFIELLNEIEATQYFYRIVEKTTVEEIIKRITMCKTQRIGRFRCDCDAEIIPTLITIKMYSHTEGIGIEGIEEKQWVYYHCTQCSYDWALWKLEMKLDPVRG